MEIPSHPQTAARTTSPVGRRDHAELNPAGADKPLVDATSFQSGGKYESDRAGKPETNTHAPRAAMASSVGLGTVAPAAAASPAGRSPGRRAARPATARAVPAATKVAAAKAEEKGLFDAIFGALYKEEQLLETDPILNKVEGRAPAAPAPRKAAGKPAAAQSGGDGGFSFRGLFAKKG